MPHTATTHPGSGTVPSIYSSLPGESDYKTKRAVVYRDAEAVAIMNPEDLSAYRGGGDTQIVALTGGAAQRLDKGVEGRRAVAIINTHETAILYIGFRDTITTSAGPLAGWPILPRTGITIDCTNRYKIWGRSTVAIDAGVMEVC